MEPTGERKRSHNSQSVVGQRYHVATIGKVASGAQKEAQVSLKASTRGGRSVDIVVW